jgi:hypothetical protein
MGMNERFVELKKSDRVSMFAEPSIKKTNEPPGFNTQVGHVERPGKVRMDLQPQVFHG